jgi:anti-anti-sigma regulatory factor
MHIVADARHPTVDLSRLRFADSASIQAFVRADRVLKADGGAMELVAPPPAVAQVLSLLSADQFIAVRPAPAPGALEGPPQKLTRPAGHGRSTQDLSLLWDKTA